jgi:hypothetical protein|tara:strand:- start:323 stop:571 length:249 start_codon:yes stop_codon:yes gene_type:complete
MNRKLIGLIVLILCGVAIATVYVGCNHWGDTEDHSFCKEHLPERYTPGSYEFGDSVDGPLTCEVCGRVWEYKKPMTHVGEKK